MLQYLDIVNTILTIGERKANRTGMDTLAIAGCIFKHDMGYGFPLLTTKKVPFGLVASELEFFIKGITDKRWLQRRNNHIWDDWCSPRLVPYGNDPDTIKKMKEEYELGPVYGWNWRYFNKCHKVECTTPSNPGVDQLKNLVNKLKEDPSDRRMIVSAWNPAQLDSMALPPCHYAFQVTVINGKLNLAWNQRSVDVALGLPFNIASYGLLLHLLAKEAGLKEGFLIGFLMDTHIYVNHIEGLKKQIDRQIKYLPHVETKGRPRIGELGFLFDIFDWEYTNTELMKYDPHPGIKFDISV